MLYNIEKEKINKLSKFNKVAVSSKPLEKQNMSICFNDFLEEITRVLKTNLDLDNVGDIILILSLLIKQTFQIVNRHCEKYRNFT